MFNHHSIIKTVDLAAGRKLVNWSNYNTELIPVVRQLTDREKAQVCECHKYLANGTKPHPIEHDVKAGRVYAKGFSGLESPCTGRCRFSEIAQLPQIVENTRPRTGQSSAVMTAYWTADEFSVESSSDRNFVSI